MEQQRYYWIDACKTFGLLLVILGHGRLFPESYQQFIYSFHMPLFFVLSGFLYKYKTTKETIKHDVYRLIIPYFLISFICLLIQFSLLFSQGGISLNEICKRVLGIFFVACYTGQFPPASGPTWFIITLFFVRILLSLKDSKWYILGLTIISIIAFLLFKKKGFDPWLPIDTALMAIPFVTVGISLKPMRDHNFSKNKYLVGIISIVLMIALLLVFNSYNGLVDMSWCSYGNSIIVFYLNGFLGTLALLIICRLLPMGGAVFNNFCVTISKGSLLIIGFNLLMVMVFQTVVEMIIPNHFITPIVGLFVGVMILYCFYLSIKLCQRYFPIILGTK